MEGESWGELYYQHDTEKMIDEFSMDDRYTHWHPP
jgi:hypothetical protein